MKTQYAVASKKYRDELKTAGISFRGVEVSDADWERFKSLPGGNHRERLILLLQNYFKQDAN